MTLELTQDELAATMSSLMTVLALQGKNTSPAFDDVRSALGKFESYIAARHGEMGGTVQ